MKIVVEQLFKLMGALDSAPSPMRQEYMEIIKKHSDKSSIESSDATWWDQTTFFNTFKFPSDAKVGKKLTKKLWEATKQLKPKEKLYVELKPLQSTVSLANSEETPVEPPTPIESTTANEIKMLEVNQDEEQYFVNLQVVTLLSKIAYGKEDADVKFEMLLSLIGADGMNKQDLTQVLGICLSKNELSSITGKLPEFVEILFGLIDSEKQGVITVPMFKQFYSSFAQNSTVKKERSGKESKKKKTPKEKLIKFGLKVEAFLRMEGLVIFAFFMFLVGNIFFFLREFFVYATKEYLVTIAGYGIPVSRGAAGAIKFNSLIVLLPVCRGLMTYIRSTVFDDFLPLDDSIKFHKAAAMLILLFGYIHSIAHYVNAYRVSLGDLPTLRIAVGNFFDSLPGSSHMARILLTSIPGITGHLLLLVMTLLVLTAHKRVRVWNFEFFWYIHHLFIVYFVLVVIHGLGSLLNSPEAFIYVIAPLFAYGIERMIRAKRGKYKLEVADVKHFPAKTVLLEFKRPDDFHYQPGQYVFINVANCSRIEWHPFTLTSSPEQGVLSVQMRVVGNWTSRLWKAIESTPKDQLQVSVDGPFGCASQYVFNYKVIMLIGAGIGVTPYASVLRHISFLFQNRKTVHLELEKAHFYWICREQLAFTWFAEMLRELEEHDQERRVNINVYITGAKKRGDIASFLLWLALEHYHGRGKDALTELQCKTNFGRPDFPKILTQMKVQYPDSEVGVFFCGPKPMARNIHRTCIKYSDRSTKFSFHMEHF